MIEYQTKKNYPLFGMQWHITDDCDQRCKHCYIYNTPEKDLKSSGKPLPELLKILGSFEDFCNRTHRVPRLAITGGDPILHPQFWQLLDEVHYRGIRFSLMGNPFHITDKKAKRLADLGCLNYQMSLDGLEKTHDFIRKKGSFKATLDTIPVLANAGVPPAIMATVSKINYKEIVPLIDLLSRTQTSMFTFARYAPTHSDLDSQISPLEYRNFLGKVLDKYEEYQDLSLNLILKDHLWKLFLFEKGLFNPKKTDMIEDGCHCGISHITVLADGLVYSCRRCESPVGKVPEKPLYNIFFGKKMDAYRQWDKFEECSDCEIFNYCRGCPAVAKGATGNFYARDPQCWKGMQKQR